MAQEVAEEAGGGGGPPPPTPRFKWKTPRPPSTGTGAPTLATSQKSSRVRAAQRLPRGAPPHAPPLTPGGLDTRLPVPPLSEVVWSWVGAFLGIMAVSALNQVRCRGDTIDLSLRCAP